MGLHRKEEAMRFNMWEFKGGADLWNSGRMPLEQESGDGYPWIMQKKAGPISDPAFRSFGNAQEMA